MQAEGSRGRSGDAEEDGEEKNQRKDDATHEHVRHRRTEDDTERNSGFTSLHVGQNIRGGTHEHVRHRRTEDGISLKNRRGGS